MNTIEQVAQRIEKLIEDKKQLLQKELQREIDKLIDEYQIKFDNVEKYIFDNITITPISSKEFIKSKYTPEEERIRNIKLDIWNNSTDAEKRKLKLVTWFNNRRNIDEIIKEFGKDYYEQLEQLHKEFKFAQFITRKDTEGVFRNLTPST